MFKRIYVTRQPANVFTGRIPASVCFVESTRQLTGPIQSAIPFSGTCRYDTTVTLVKLSFRM